MIVKASDFEELEDLRPGMVNPLRGVPEGTGGSPERGANRASGDEKARFCRSPDAKSVCNVSASRGYDFR